MGVYIRREELQLRSRRRGVSVHACVYVWACASVCMCARPIVADIIMTSMLSPWSALAAHPVKRIPCVKAESLPQLPGFGKMQEKLTLKKKSMFQHVPV